MKRGQTFWFGLIGLFFALVVLSIFVSPMFDIMSHTVGADSDAPLPSFVLSVIGLAPLVLFLIVLFAFITLISPSR